MKQLTHGNALAMPEYRSVEKLMPMVKLMFAEWHKEKRKSMKLTQLEMAEMLGVGYKSLQAYEGKTRFPDQLEFYIECVHHLERTLKGLK